MKKGFILIVVGYGAWVILNIIITFFKIGDAGVNAHLALVFTGLPTSLLSLLVPHGTLLAVLIAGILGLIQWSLVAKLWKKS